MAAESVPTVDGAECAAPSPGSPEGSTAGADGHSVNRKAEGQAPSQPADPASTSNAAAASDVLEKLASLEVARKAERERRREELRAAADPRESIAQFLRGFSSRQRRIEAALQSMLLQQQQQFTQSTQPQGACAPSAANAADGGTNTPLAVSAASPEEVTASLELLSSEVLSLEQSAAAASYYLPLYDQKQCAATVTALRAGIEGARSALAPRRRFAFGSKKVNKVRGEEISAAAQAGPAQAPGPSGPAPAGAGVEAAQQPAAATATVSPAACGNAAGVDDHDAPAALVVSEQDRALVARGRGLMGLTDAQVVLRAEEVEEGGGGGAAGGDFVLLGLTRCRVVLLGRLRALRLAGLRGCTVLAGPVTGAVFADDVRSCTLSLAAYQVRVHRTHATDLFLRVRSKPIIEHSAGVRVAPWAAGVAREPRLEALLQAHKLGEGDDTACWQQVDDFGWIKAVQSPNWCVMPEAARPAQPKAIPEGVWERRAAAATLAEQAPAAGGGEDVDEI